MKHKFLFSVFIIFFIFVFIALGTWQIIRLNWKNNLILEIENSLKNPPVQLSQSNQKNYLKIKTSGSVDFEKQIYLYNLNSRYDLDGDFSYNTARLINHSCDPNCEVEGKGLEIWVTSIRFIEKGEELSYDYGFGFDQDYKQFPCKCGSKKCCGYIVREGSRWRINKKFKINKVSK